MPMPVYTRQHRADCGGRQETQSRCDENTDCGRGEGERRRRGRSNGIRNGVVLRTHGGLEAQFATRYRLSADNAGAFDREVVAVLENLGDLPVLDDEPAVRDVPRRAARPDRRVVDNQHPRLLGLLGQAVRPEGQRERFKDDEEAVSRLFRLFRRGRASVVCCREHPPNRS